MPVKIPSMPASDGALSFVATPDPEEDLDNPTWTPVGLVTDWKVDPGKEHQLLFYGGNRRLANDKKIGEQYSVSWSADVHDLTMFERVTKDVAGAGTPDEYIALACRVKYNNIDHYFLLKGVLLGEVVLTIARDVIKSTYTGTVFISADIHTLAEFKTETGLDVGDDPVFSAAPTPDPLTHLSPTQANRIPLTVNTVDTRMIQLTITHTNAIVPIVCTNDIIASGGAVGHQSVKVGLMVYEDGLERWDDMKADTTINLEYKITTNKKLVMNGFKINTHPISHPQTGDELGTIDLNLDGPRVTVANYP